MDGISTTSTHIKFLAFQFMSLTNQPSFPPLISRAESVGVIVAVDRRPHLLKFLIDDGTGCIPCILWLNHLHSPYFSRHSPTDVRLLADAAAHHASAVRLGALARVRGRITAYRGTAQITVRDVIVERDPNAEILHRLDCIRLAKECYNDRFGF